MFLTNPSVRECGRACITRPSVHPISASSFFSVCFPLFSFSFSFPFSYLLLALRRYMLLTTASRAGGRAKRPGASPELEK